MKYLVELEFENGVHFGSDLAGYGVEEVQGFAHADTLFSAFLNTMAQARREFSHLSWLQNLLDPQDEPVLPPFRLSSFGFVDRENELTFYLPKPLSAPLVKDNNQSSAQLKDLKNREFISLQSFKQWQQGIAIDLNQLLIDEREQFWIPDIKIQHRTDSITHASQIYRTGLCFYPQDIHPFFLVDLDTDLLYLEDFEKVLNIMAFNGLGGRRSGGCGAFKVFKIWPLDKSDSSDKSRPEQLSLWQDIFSFIGDRQYLFSTLFPKEPDPLQKDKSVYKLIPRKGWVFSTSSFKQVKRKTCYMFAEGSVFSCLPEGKLVDVTPDSIDFEHRVYRYGIPFTIPFRG
ncbi:type III-A CRISPR-associated RAMP protein Csm4 [candidate division KSB1 bacterium]|nr:type III-A CRISPR-associated RAMP protein Csm4 [candidate division KSB1 bacterium]